MKYCEDMEHGNTYFVSDWWHMIDYSKVNGYDHHPINSIVESTWKIIKKFQQSDKEEIADIWNKYCCGIDEWDLETTAFVLDENIFSNIPNNPINSRKELLELFKRKRQNENVMSHVGKIVDIKINGNFGNMYVWRYEPHRIGTKILSLCNIDSMFYSVKYNFHVKKLIISGLHTK